MYQCFFNIHDYTLNVHNPNGIKRHARLQVAVCHLRVHKLRHNVQDSLVLFSTAVVIMKQLFT